MDWILRNIEWLLSGLGLAVIGVLNKQIQTLFKSFLSKLNRKSSLEPFYTRKEVEESLKNYIPTMCQNVDPARFEEVHNSYALATQENLLKFFLNKVFKNKNDEQKYFIVLGGSGMGKTTFLINLYYKFTSKPRIGNPEIKLYPLNNVNTLKRIEQISNKSNTILLLDAFDEDRFANDDAETRLNRIIEIAWEFKFLIITCRTQFFPSENQEPFEILLKKAGPSKGYHHFHKIYVSPFNEKNIITYIKNKIPFTQKKKRKAAIDFMNKNTELLARPMILSKIELLLKTKNKFSHSFKIYAVIVDAWLERESSIKSASSRHSYYRSLMNFSLDAAKLMMQNLKDGNRLIIYKDQIDQLAKNRNIQLKGIELRSRSLLNRYPTGEYKFSHKSIFEYFLANYCFLNDEDLPQYQGLTQANTFLLEMSEDIILSSKTDQNLKIEKILQLGKAYYFTQRYNKASSVFELVKGQKPYIFNYYKGCILNKEQNNEKALLFLQKGRQLKLDESKCLNKMIRIYYENNNFDMVIKLINQANANELDKENTLMYSISLFHCDLFYDSYNALESISTNENINTGLKGSLLIELEQYDKYFDFIQSSMFSTNRKPENYFIEIKEEVYSKEKDNKIIKHILNNYNSTIDWPDQETLQKTNEFEVISEIEKVIIEVKNLYGNIDISFNERVLTNILSLFNLKQFKQVIFNLLFHSIKTNNDDIKIKIGVYDIDEVLLIEVSDNGNGYEDTELANLFSAQFFRTSNNVLLKYSLVSAKKFIEKNNQTINVISSPNLGTTIGFTIRKSRNVA